MKIKWYLSTWFISLWFIFSILIIPFIIGLILLILRIKADKKIKKEWQEQGFDQIIDIQQRKQEIEKEIEKIKSKSEDDINKYKREARQEINKKQIRLIKEIRDSKKEIEGERLQADKDIAKLNKNIQRLESKVKLLEEDIKLKSDEIITLDDELLYQSFGFYDPKYALENSDQFKAKLNEIRATQKEMVKNKIATNHYDEWQLDGSKQKGKVMNNNNIKLTLRSFNNECDAAISNVKFNNINSMEKRIKKSFDQLNKTNKNNRIEIKKEYLALKLDELYLAFEYAQKKEEEKEEQRQLREQIREEKRVQQEIEKQRKKLEKDEKHHKQALLKYQEQLENASEELKTDIVVKINEINSRMAELKKEQDQVDYREQNAKAGYVYIISNIGSFGENVYKIGMTRRLEPDDRVKELGDASVPFRYDVHAMIFSDDAPALEAALHREFDNRRLNLVNMRKEFFKVSLDEISEIVKAKHDKVVEFTKLAEAEEWRKSEKIRNKQTKSSLKEEISI
ncbi:DUF4041 domain-containing protein [Gracilibacillus alcaliphilus]|uniref:DUF4041 domain-containing protein n=1 Tax=Gracilibacillus alcaliphilus TaxID=1401441 RepID=UPI00195BE581|nr:DUF4041 domain-containing protein [Gracilibacillus alcaliphilus]MBM7678927.1 outer membrane murein-binding lipoprotein Lpp [Gracilibacillus alcaliphilus]